MSKIVIVGLGYVGLPLVILASNKGHDVVGFDIDKSKIESLNKGVSYIDDIDDKRVADCSAIFTNDSKLIKDCDVVIICVPTPVTKEKMPDLGPVKGAIEVVVPYLKKGCLLVIESTINPGVCDEVIIPLIESISDKKVGEDILLAHCPERINPGDSKWNVSNISRVLGASTHEGLQVAQKLYESIIDAEIKPMGSLKEAEAVKVVENSFRDINIAFVNELAMSFHKLGINLENVIDGAATKPFAFMAHRPGCGVGGHCIPVDPYYLIEYANGYGFQHDFLRKAREINESMPLFTVNLLKEALTNRNLRFTEANVVLLGMSYKANVGDARESPAYKIKALLEESGIKVQAYDPYIKEYSKHNLDKLLDQADAVVIATAHDEFKKIVTPENLVRSGVKIVIDGRNMLKSKKRELEKHNLTYFGIGV